MGIWQNIRIPKKQPILGVEAFDDGPIEEEGRKLLWGQCRKIKIVDPESIHAGFLIPHSP
jgi:hypothetical protein